jgi:hypothetical protein
MNNYNTRSLYIYNIYSEREREIHHKIYFLCVSIQYCRCTYFFKYLVKVSKIWLLTNPYAPYILGRREYIISFESGLMMFVNRAIKRECLNLISCYNKPREKQGRPSPLASCMCLDWGHQPTILVSVPTSYHHPFKMWSTYYVAILYWS